ncbi:MAG: Gfo/Idh/MocA family oxidoreductase, partial [Planctomycetota bacterium]|nr:Gfo/Idh/MocA family oxidoreductase [Planctomycetota bacterium]
MDRREFLKTSTSTAAAATVLAGHQVAKAAASERLRVGMVGGGGRAFSLNCTFASNPNVEIVAIADLDSAKRDKAMAEVTKRQGKQPAGEKDFRRVIDDYNIDALVVGTPDHWHAIPTIMACQAGIDVYVEKPDGHNIVEGQRMVAALKKHKRVVQMGS